MRLGVDVRGGAGDEVLAFGRQLGAVDAVAGPGCLPGDGGHYGFHDLVLLRRRVEDAGLILAAVENVPWEWNDKIKLGLPGRDEQIDSWCKTLRNMGAAGIPVFGYNFRPPSRTGYGYRTSQTAHGRGGARVSSFDYDLIEGAPPGEYGEITDEQMWDNLTYFLKAVIPVAEQAGVRMALHPDDPPVSPIEGVARILGSHAGLRRLVETVPSDCNGLDFCQGAVAAMPESVLDAIRYFGSRNKIVYVHFRNISGTAPRYAETFIDEGYVDMAEAMAAYKEVGFSGTMIDDHVPTMSDDPEKYRSRAYAMGYIKALMDAVGGPD